MITWAKLPAGSSDGGGPGSTVEVLRGLPPWRARADAWRANAAISWGPIISDARRLYSREVLEVVAAHVGAGVGEVADRLLGMRSQHRYLLLGTIARTRRCTVIGAVDQLLARSVALKIPHDSDDETTWKLLAEVQAMTRVEHEHVVTVLDVGDHEGRLYAALELCDANLDAWSVGQRWAVVLDRIIEAGRGLAAVHAAGLVHGDIKPENVLLKDGAAKLGDFGMAARPGWSTRIGGTAGYIAPEVADGHQGAAGDVFALACTAWFCLTGERPFGEPPVTASSSAAALVLIERAREGEVQVPDADVPRAVLAALRGGLDPDPVRRSSLAVLLEQLGRLRSAGTLARWVWSKRLGTLARGSA